MNEQNKNLAKLADDNFYKYNYLLTDKKPFITEKVLFKSDIKTTTKQRCGEALTMPVERGKQQRKAFTPPLSPSEFLG
jgi:predicted short-subunit dehydrogenase-like oxidoreductase (DUF2520 family)